MLLAGAALLAAPAKSRVTASYLASIAEAALAVFCWGRPPGFSEGPSRSSYHPGLPSTNHRLRITASIFARLTPLTCTFYPKSCSVFPSRFYFYDCNEFILAFFNTSTASLRQPVSRLSQLRTSGPPIDKRAKSASFATASPNPACRGQSRGPFRKVPTS